MKNLILYLFIFLISINIVFANKNTKTIVSEGSATFTGNDIGKIRDEAILDAQIKALQQVVGVFIEEETIATNFTDIEENIYTKTNGYISTYEVITNSEKIEDIGNIKIYKISIKAEVNIDNVYNKLSNLKGLYDKIERPKFYVIATAKNNIGTDDSDVLESIMYKNLKSMGFDIVDKTIIDISKSKEPYKDLIAHGIKVLIRMDADTYIKNSDLDMGKFNIDYNCGECSLTTKFINLSDGNIYYTKPTIGHNKELFSTNYAGISANCVKEAVNKFFSKSNTEEIKAELFNKWVEIADYKTFSLKFYNVKVSDIREIQSKIKDTDRFHIGYGKINYKNRSVELVIYTKNNIQTIAENIENFKLENRHFEIDSFDKNKIEVSIIDDEP